MECLATGIPFIVLMMFMQNHVSEIKIGLLLPKSSLYPAMGFDIRDGLKARLSLDEGYHYKLIFDNIGHGGNEELVYQKAEKLLMEEDVVAVIAFLDHTAAAKLDQLFAQAKRLLIVLDPGAQTPLDWAATSPFRYTFSLQAALNNYITGALAAKGSAGKGMFSTSFYEGGYLQSNTYLKGFGKEGGNILYHAIVPFKTKDFNIAQFQEAVAEYQPDTVLAQFSAESGAFFLEQYKQTSLPNTARCYASSFMLEEDWISTLPYPFSGITGSVSWCSKLDNEENFLFIRVLKEYASKDANLFALLGWEAALLISLFMEHCNTSVNNITQAVITFQPEEIRSPRGKLQLHQPSHTFFGPAYRVEIVEYETTGNCALALHEELTYDKQHFLNEIPEGAFSKWNNTYLCI